MGLGGVLYWRELYPDIGLTDGTDHRNLLLPAGIKYELINKIFAFLEDVLGYKVSDYEDYEMSENSLNVLLGLLKNASDLSHEAQIWSQQAIAFVDATINKGKTLGLAI